MILKFDGRRVRPGLEDDDVGDVDLAGCESGLSLAQQIEEVTSKIQKINSLIENLDLTSEVATQSSVLRIIEFLKLLSQEMLEGRKKKLSMERSLREKHKLAGTDWANSKYKKIISYLTVLIRKSEETL